MEHSITFSACCCWFGRTVPLYTQSILEITEIWLQASPPALWRFYTTEAILSKVRGSSPALKELKPNQTKQRTFYFGIIIETQEVPKIMKKCPLHSTPFPLGRTFTCKSIIAFAPLDINRRKLCILSAAPLPLLFLYFENTEILFFSNFLRSPWVTDVWQEIQACSAL